MNLGHSFDLHHKLSESFLAPDMPERGHQNIGKTSINIWIVNLFLGTFGHQTNHEDVASM